MRRRRQPRHRRVPESESEKTARGGLSVLTREPHPDVRSERAMPFAVEPSRGITVVRLMMGAILLVAGIQKWANGIGGFIGFVTQLGIPAAPVLAPLLAAGEVVGGLLLLLGLGTRWVS